MKQMLLSLKQLKDSGEIAEKDFADIKREFLGAYGSSIEDVVKEAEAQGQEMDATERELVQLMKEILG
jgi:hypothetical protein